MERKEEVREYIHPQRLWWSSLSWDTRTMRPRPRRGFRYGTSPSVQCRVRVCVYVCVYYCRRDCDRLSTRCCCCCSWWKRQQTRGKGRLIAIASRSSIQLTSSLPSKCLSSLPPSSLYTSSNSNSPHSPMCVCVTMFFVSFFLTTTTSGISNNGTHLLSLSLVLYLLVRKYNEMRFSSFFLAFLLLLLFVWLNVVFSCHSFSFCPALPCPAPFRPFPTVITNKEAHIVKPVRCLLLLCTLTRRD